MPRPWLWFRASITFQSFARRSLSPCGQSVACCVVSGTSSVSRMQAFTYLKPSRQQRSPSLAATLTISLVSCVASPLHLRSSSREPDGIRSARTSDTISEPSHRCAARLASPSSPLQCIAQSEAKVQPGTLLCHFQRKTIPAVLFGRAHHPSLSYRLTYDPRGHARACFVPCPCGQDQTLTPHKGTSEKTRAGISGNQACVVVCDSQVSPC